MALKQIQNSVIIVVTDNFFFSNSTANFVYDKKPDNSLFIMISTHNTNDASSIPICIFISLINRWVSQINVLKSKKSETNKKTVKIMSIINTTVSNLVI